MRSTQDTCTNCISTVTIDVHVAEGLFCATCGQKPKLVCEGVLGSRYLTLLLHVGFHFIT